MSDLLLVLSKLREPSALLTTLNKQRYAGNAMLEKHNAQTRQTRESTKTFELRFRAKLNHSSKICRASQNRARSDKTVPPQSSDHRKENICRIPPRTCSFSPPNPHESAVRGQGLQLEPGLLQSMNTSLDSCHLARTLQVAYSPHPHARRCAAIWQSTGPTRSCWSRRSVRSHAAAPRSPKEDDQSSDCRKLIRHSSPQRNCANAAVGWHEAGGCAEND